MVKPGVMQPRGRGVFGSEALEVGIGLALLFLIVSLICSAVREFIELVMKQRASDLERGIRELMGEGGKKKLSELPFTKALYGHGQIYSLFNGKYDGPGALKRRKLPSYIPAQQFSAAFLDIILRGKTPQQRAAATPADVISGLSAAMKDLPAPIRDVLATALDEAGEDVGKLRKHIENWFDGSMDRVSGWYKRKTNLILFGLGLATAATLNIDALTVARRLAENDAVRAAFLARAENASDFAVPLAAEPGPSGDLREGSARAQVRVDDLRSELAKIGAPLGWTLRPQAPNNEATPFSDRLARSLASRSPEPQSCRGQVPPGCKPADLRFLDWVSIWLGWLITAAAVTLGAPFWFDVLNKIMVIRSTVKPKEKSPEEGSEDRGGRRTVVLKAG
jgi:hypothetical protein